MQLYTTLDKLEKQGRSSSEDFTRTIFKTLEHLNYNVGFLFPYMFPMHLYGAPLDLMNRPFAFAMTELVRGATVVTRGGRQIAKSTTLAARMLTIAHSLPFRQMYVAPHSDQTETFARRMRDLERDCRFKVHKSKYKQNDYYKEYPLGGVIELYNVYTEAIGIRGKSTDMFNLDEAQNFDGSLLPEVEQVTKASRFKIYNISGTSLNLDTYLETEYLDGSQGTWHIPLPCVSKSGNRLYLDCGDKEQVLTAIREKGLCCPHTGRVINPIAGQFVHAYPERMLKNQISLHVPQIIVPEYANDPYKWLEIWDALRKYEARGQINKFIQEILGIPTEAGARELSESELQDICILGRMEVVQTNAKRRNYYKYVISGIDWGGSDHNAALRTKISFTFHVMIGVRFDGTVDIIHMRKYAGMRYNEIIPLIKADHHRYHGQMVASDFSAGTVYNQLFRDIAGISWKQHVIFGYTGPKTAAVGVPTLSELENHLSLNRNESITSIILAIKSGRIRCYDWEEAHGHLSDFLNVMRVFRENTASGESTFQYLRAGNRPDDGLHACNFAFALARLCTGEPLLHDREAYMTLQAGLLGQSMNVRPVPMATVPRPRSG